MTAAPNNSMQLEGKTILLGITGGIAAYKSCNIVRLLQKRGARVKVVMSEHATEFVGPLTFRALTNEPVAVGLFDRSLRPHPPHFARAGARFDSRGARDGQYHRQDGKRYRR